MQTEKFEQPKNSAATRRDRRRGPGRPPGTTAQGEARRKLLYDTAIRLITKCGYEAATLRDVAKEAGVSVGLLYRYYPSKRTVVLAFYDELSAQYAARAAEMQPGRWRDRFLFALSTSLETLKPHRNTLSALVSVLIGDRSEGLFAPGTAFSRERVQKVFHEAVSAATDAPKEEVAVALAQLLYLTHLAVILWWLLDKSLRQRATDALIALLKEALPTAALALRLRTARAFIIAGEKAFRDAMLDYANQ